MIRGLPGSGKSTMAQGMPEHHLIEADQFFMHGIAYKFDPKLLPQAHALCQERTKFHLKQGRNVVVANTFTQKWEMQPYLNMAAELDIPVRIIVATGNFENIHGVPEKAISRMRERWEE